MKGFSCLSLIFVWVLNLSATAQLLNLHFNRFTIHDGLTSPIVTSIVKDKSGFLWFGTINGLNRYDGYQFRAFFNDPMDSQITRLHQLSVIREAIYGLEQDI